MKNTKIVKKKLVSRADPNSKPKSARLPSKNYIYTSLGISGVSILLVLVLKNFLPPEVPLYYGEAIGENQLTSSIGLIIPGAVALSVTIINSLLALLIENHFLQKLLIQTSLAVSALGFITTVKIILLIGSFNF